MDTNAFKDLANPFDSYQKVGNEWMPPPGNIPKLFDNIHRKCTELLQTVRSKTTGISLMVHGEAGSGKTHLITQLRKETIDDPKTVLVRISFEKMQYGRIWLHIREQFIAELTRQNWNPYDPKDTGLRRILMGSFPGWTDDPESSPFDWIFGRATPSEVLHHKLQENAPHKEVSYELRKVLPKLYDKKLAPLARDWLKGNYLGSDDLKSLGLSHHELNDVEREDVARDVVLSISRLASPEVTILICIDEIEGMLTGGDDRVVMRSLTKSITNWIHEDGNRLFVTFLRPDTVGKLQANGEPSHFQKMSQTTLTLEPVNWEQLVQVVICRLNLNADWVAIRKQHMENRFWPLTEEWLHDLYQNEGDVLTPRHLIRACMAEVNRLQIGNPVKPPRPPKPVKNPAPPIVIVPPPPLDNLDCILQSKWDKRCTHFLTRPSAIDFDQVVGSTLRWLVGVCDVPLTLSDSIDKSIGDITLIFKGTKAKAISIAISLCDHPLTSLRHRLKRLVEQQQKGKADKLFNKLFILRSKDGSLTPTSQGYLDQLERGGASIYYLDPQQLVELAAYHYMLTNMQKGEYTFDGKPVDAEVFNQWAKENLSSSVKEFAHAIFDLSGSLTSKAKPEAKTNRQPVLNFS